MKFYEMFSIKKKRWCDFSNKHFVIFEHANCIISLVYYVDEMAKCIFQTFPASIGAMKHLKKLFLRKENHLTSLPPDIGECAMLEDLIIYR